MLLRASRASEFLTKEALVSRLVGAGARAATRGAVGTAKGVGKGLWRHKKAVGVGGMVVGIPAVSAAEDISRGNAGMNQQWTAARMQGRVGRLPQM